MANEQIKSLIKANNLFFWQVAEKIGLNDGNFSRMLRRELSPDKKLIVEQAIEALSKENKDGKGLFRPSAGWQHL